MYFSSSAFWITIDSPNVATIANAGSTPTTRSNTSRCRITADHERAREHEHERRQRIDGQRGRQRQRHVRGEDRQVTVGEVDEPHHAEAERQSGGEQRVEAADQDALHDRVDPRHR